MVLTLVIAGVAFAVGLLTGALRRRYRLTDLRDRMQHKIDALEELIGLERMRMRNLEDVGQLIVPQPWIESVPDRVTRARRPVVTTE